MVSEFFSLAILVLRVAGCCFGSATPSSIVDIFLEPEPEPNLFLQLYASRPPGDSWHHQIGDLRDLDALRSLVIRVQPEIVLHLQHSLVRRS